MNKEEKKKGENLQDIQLAQTKCQQVTTYNR
jgi:hypothetical protein